MTPEELKSQTLEEAARARERVIREANLGASWIQRHPMAALIVLILLGGTLGVLAIKAFT